MEEVFAVWQTVRGTYEYLGELILAFRRRSFLTIGFSGTGKTELLRSVTRANIQDDPRMPTIHTTTGLGTVGATKLVVVDTAGNVSLFETIVRQEIERAQSGGYLGILNVTAYGYNEPRGGYRLSSKHVDVYADDSNMVNPEFLEIERKNELAFLQRWLEIASASGQIGWIFCAMNKYDLWRHQADEVRHHYGPDGPYGRLMREAFGRSFLEGKYQTCEVCAALSNFHGRQPEAHSDYSRRDAAELNAVFLAKFEHRVSS